MLIIMFDCYTFQSPESECLKEKSEQEARLRSFVYDPTLPLSLEAQKKAVVIDNHNLNNVKVREHILKLVEEQKLKREMESETNDATARNSPLFHTLYQYRTLVIVGISALFAFVVKAFHSGL